MWKGEVTVMAGRGVEVQIQLKVKTGESGEGKVSRLSPFPSPDC
jgi:hypothetical protein